MNKLTLIMICLVIPAIAVVAFGQLAGSIYTVESTIISTQGGIASNILYDARTLVSSSPEGLGLGSICSVTIGFLGAVAASSVGVGYWVQKMAIILPPNNLYLVIIFVVSVMMFTDLFRKTEEKI